MSSGEIEAILAAELNLSPEELMVVWEKVLAAMRKALLTGRSVTLLNICTLEPYMSASSKYRHPETHKLMPVPARKCIRLMVARSLKETLRASE